MARQMMASMMSAFDKSDRLAKDAVVERRFALLWRLIVRIISPSVAMAQFIYDREPSENDAVMSISNPMPADHGSAGRPQSGKLF